VKNKVARFYDPRICLNHYFLKRFKEFTKYRLFYIDSAIPQNVSSFLNRGVRNYSVRNITGYVVHSSQDSK